MTSEAAFAVAVLIGGGALLVGVQALPPLNPTAVTDADQNALARDRLQGFDSEEAFCEARLPGVDCACFADKAGQILRNKTPEAQGWVYADRFDLAMYQSQDSCR